jgi:hypothetical protein
MAALDQAGELLEIPLILGNVASDNRRYTAAGFPSVGVALGGAGGHTPADTAEHLGSGAMQLAAGVLRRRQERVTRSSGEIRATVRPFCGCSVCIYTTPWAGHYIEDNQYYTETSVEEQATMQILNRDGTLSHRWQPTDRADSAAADDRYLAMRNNHRNALVAEVRAFTRDVLHHTSATSCAHQAVAKHVVAAANFVVCCS